MNIQTPEQKRESTWRKRDLGCVFYAVKDNDFARRVSAALKAGDGHRIGIKWREESERDGLKEAIKALPPEDRKLVYLVEVDRDGKEIK